MGKAIDENGGYQSLINEYNREQEQNNDRVVGGRYPQDYRQKVSIFANVEGQKVKDDYVGPKMNVGGKIGLKYFLTPYLNMELNIKLLYA